MLKYLVFMMFLFNSLYAFASVTGISNDDKQYMIEYINGMYNTIENINKIKIYKKENIYEISDFNSSLFFLRASKLRQIKRFRLL